MSRLIAGQAVQISPLVRRLLAPNPSWETGPGTNTYLVGRERVTVVDPGPDDAGHVAAILRSAGDRIERIVVTHTHEDHSPAAARLSALCGAPVFGLHGPDDGFQDPGFCPLGTLSHDELIDAGEYRLRAIHTPGHVGNHVCFLLEEEGVLFTGDHIMQGSTVVIIPPSGNMSHYLQSLSLLKAYPIRELAPGHGEIMSQPDAVIDQLVAHRLRREARVLDALRQFQRAALPELLPVAYADIDAGLYGLAELSLWAHLLKLVDDGRALQQGEHWHYTGSAAAGRGAN